jgi:hydrogenase-4 component E
MVELILMAVVLLNLSLLGGRMLKGCISRVALQGFLTALFGLAVHAESVSGRLVGLALLAMVAKAAVFPWLLTRAMRVTEITEERRPFLGVTLSMTLGIVLVMAGFYLGRIFPVSSHEVSRLAMPVSYATMFSGLLLVIARRTVLFQAIGYLAMENGIYIAGISLVSGLPFLVELGVLLDVIAAVLVMVVVVQQIDQESNGKVEDSLSELKG